MRSRKRCGWRIVDSAVAQSFDQGMQRSQRRTQFVRHIAHEVLAHSLQPPQLRQVLQQHQDSRAGASRQGRDDHADELAVRHLDSRRLARP